MFCGFASYPSQSVPRLPGSASSGHSFQRLFLTPAAGYRHRESGALTNVGTEGDWWSSSSYAAGSVNAGNLNFRAGNVNPLNNTSRANGLSVRCVQASTEAVFYLFGSSIRTAPIKNSFFATRNDGRPWLPSVRFVDSAIHWQENGAKSLVGCFAVLPVIYPSLFRSCRRRLLRIIHSSDCFSCPPAAGYRSNASGALTNVGTEGLYWSSSSYAAGSVNAGNLNFRAGNVNPLNNTSRANGLSVRCVQASTEAVFYLFGSSIRTAPIKNSFFATRNDGRPWLPSVRFVDSAIHWQENGAKRIIKTKVSQKIRYYEVLVQRFRAKTFASCFAVLSVIHPSLFRGCRGRLLRCIHSSDCFFHCRGLPPL